MLRHVPGVQTVSVASVVPFGATTVVDITVIGAPSSPELERENPMFNAVDHEYFQAMRMRILRGRGLLASDAAGAEPVAVVNAAMARRYWGSQDPFDSCILAPPNPCARVVGVVTDIRETPGNAAAPMRYYLSRAQTTARTEALILRVSPERVPGAVAAVRSLVPGEARPAIDVVKERVAVSLRPWSTATVLFVSLGAVALALACVGIYSVMSYLVSERLFEMGIRLALGATRADITWLVLTRGIRLVLAGTALGLGAALLLGRVIGSLLFQVSTFEPAIYGAAAAAFVALAIGAMLPVARRAALVEPVETLRSE
jgi:hypothetical protein